MIDKLAYSSEVGIIDLDLSTVLFLDKVLLGWLVDEGRPRYRPQTRLCRQEGRKRTWEAKCVGSMDAELREELQVIDLVGVRREMERADQVSLLLGMLFWSRKRERRSFRWCRLVRCFNGTLASLHFGHLRRCRRHG